MEKSGKLITTKHGSTLGQEKFQGYRIAEIAESGPQYSANLKEFVFGKIVRSKRRG
jgi:hypothetical protein